MTRRGCLIGMLIFAGVLIILGLWVRHGEFWAVDACLDSGGAWDYEAKECRH